MQPALELTGRRALVIGAGTPAGRAIATALATSGADVAVAAATIDGDEVMAARRTRRAIEALGRRSAEYAFDTTLGQNVQVSTRQVSKEMGGLDILINAQDAPAAAPAERLSDSEWARTLALNLNGVFFACRAAVREMQAGGGAIVNVIREPADLAAGQSAYLAARDGVAGLTRALAAEYADRGIRFNLLRMASNSDPAQAGALAVFLVSDAGLTGQVLSVPEPPLIP